MTDSEEKTVAARVPADMHLEARLKATRQGKSLSQVIRELLARWLANGGADKKKQQKT